MVTETSTLV